MHAFPNAEREEEWGHIPCLRLSLNSEDARTKGPPPKIAQHRPEITQNYRNNPSRMEGGTVAISVTAKKWFAGQGLGRNICMYTRYVYVFFQVPTSRHLTEMNRVRPPFDVCTTVDYRLLVRSINSIRSTCIRHHERVKHFGKICAFYSSVDLMPQKCSSYCIWRIMKMH